MSPFFKTNTKKRNHSARKGIFGRLGLKQKISVFLFSLSALLIVVYLFQINDLAIKGFEIKNLQNKIKEFEQKNKNTELIATDLRTLSNIDELKKELNMVKVGQIEYISSSASVAARR